MLGRWRACYRRTTERAIGRRRGYRWFRLRCRHGEQENTQGLAGSRDHELRGDNNPDCGPDGVPQVVTQLDRLGVAADGAGAVYIADWFSGRVSKVSGGVVTTVLDHVVGLTGVAADTAGNAYSTGYGITKIAPNGVVSTMLVSNIVTTCAAVDQAGNVYVADEGGPGFNGTIKKVNLRGVVSPLVDTSLSYPRGVAVDAAGNLYIADSNNFLIRKISLEGALSTVAGNRTPAYSGDGGPAIDALFAQPSSVALDAAGAVYVADSSNDRVRKQDDDLARWDDHHRRRGPASGRGCGWRGQSLHRRGSRYP